MKIAVLIKSTTFNKNYGGLETQNKVLCEGLAKRGHDVTVFSPARGENDSAEEENGVKYVFVPCVYRMLFSSIDKNNWFNRSYQEFLKVHKQNPFDIVISQSSAGLGIIKRKENLNIKILGISHGTIGGEMRTLINSAKSPLDLVKKTKSLAFGIANFFGRQREYIHGCDIVVAVSNAIKKSIINETYAQNEKIVVIHNGIDGSKIPKKSWNQSQKNNPLKVLYIGRIEESKGLRELLEACSNLDNVALNIVGDGPFLEDLKKLARSLKMSQRVLFYGKLPYDKAIEMYACNDVFVLPTKRVEGLPMTLIEACFAGLPIITTNMGGNADAVENNFNGFLLDRADTVAIRQKISQLEKDRPLAEKFGTNGKIKAEKEFNLEKMIESYERVCLSLLHGKVIK